MVVTFQGTPMTLTGTPLAVGDTFPGFVLAKNDLSPLTLEDTAGVRLFATVPSLDTPVCDLETRTFNVKAASLSGVSLYVVSMDLPFAQARWCGAAGVSMLTPLSDYKDRSFGAATGTYVAELGLLTRAVFVVDAAGIVRYVQYVPEITDQPDFDAALAALRAALRLL
ncbi:MAG: thiol peroxidase [Oscillospiraceae bacterium]|nr:thiol peroxidase [Oscillospiraceae bacterium]